MERLTTDNPQNNAENALNLAYAKDRWVHILGMDEPFTDYIKKECCRNGCNLSEMSEHEICDCVTECAFINPECPIFLLFMVATQAAELRSRLAAYEDTGLTPEEIAAAADRRHNCKIECLLKRYNELSEEIAVLRQQLSEKEKEYAGLITRCNHLMVREQENKPLTLDEFLNIREPTPFWIVSIGDDFSPHWSIEFWNDSRILFEILEDNSNNTMREREVKSTYGKTWLAYRRKPGSGGHSGA